VTMFAQNATPAPSTPKPSEPPATQSAPNQTLTLSTEAIATLLDVAEATEERAQTRADAAKAELKAASDDLLEATRNATLLRDQLGSMESGDTVTATFK
jgi:hypothetical protein